VGLGLTDTAVNDVAVDRTDPNIVYAALDTGLGASTDGGRHWRFAEHGDQHDRFTTVETAPSAPNVVYATGPGLYGPHFMRSPDAGHSWYTVPSRELPRDDWPVLSLAVDVAQPDTVYIGFANSGIYQTTDLRHWHHRSDGLHGDAIPVLVTDPAVSGTVYAGTDGHGAFRSVDQGRTWESIGPPGNVAVTGIALDPTDPATIFVSWAGGVSLTRDGGASWADVIAGSGTAVAVDPVAPTFIYAATTDGLFRSVDGGVSWKPFDRGLGGRVVTSIAGDAGSVLHVGTDTGGVFEYTAS
jgi:hypothetical protein